MFLCHVCFGRTGSLEKTTRDGNSGPPMHRERGCWGACVQLHLLFSRPSTIFLFVTRNNINELPFISPSSQSFYKLEWGVVPCSPFLSHNRGHRERQYLRDIQLGYTARSPVGFFLPIFACVKETDDQKIVLSKILILRNEKPSICPVE